MRGLWAMDNLEAISQLSAGSVALAYLDPPFNSGRSYDTVVAAARQSGQELQSAFSDSWHWSDETRKLARNLGQWLPKSVSSIVNTLVSTLGESDISAYLVMMAPRLAEVHRCLQEEGSLYLHCDPAASHYLKVLLDHLFGPKNFRNEIVWKRTHAHNSSRRYGPVHDTILFYTKSPRYTWNRVFSKYSESYLTKHFRNSDERGKYQLITCTAPGDRTGTRAHYCWRNQWPPPGRHWAWKREQMEAFESEGCLEHSSNGIPRLKRYTDDGQGVAVQDIWLDINRLDSHSAERVGFETQKPIALLERLITASSNKGDVILDLFAGSGTTAVAAERLGRKWIIVDKSLMSCSTALARVRQEVNLGAVSLKGFPEDSRAARDLLRSDPFAFGIWGASMLATLPSRKETNNQVVTGSGNLTVKSRCIELISWVPLRNPSEVPVPPSGRRRLTKLGLILRHGRSAATARRQLEGRVSIPLYEIDLAHLVDRDALRCGISPRVAKLVRH